MDKEIEKLLVHVSGLKQEVAEMRRNVSRETSIAGSMAARLSMQGVRCHRCSWLTPGDYGRCIWCGEKVATLSDHIQVTMCRCPKCSHVVPVACYCGECGARLPSGGDIRFVTCDDLELDGSKNYL